MLPNYYRAKRQREKARNTLIFTIIFALCATAVSLIYLKRPSAVKQVSESESRPTPVKTAALSDTAAIEITKLYSCGHSKTETIPALDNIKKKTKSEIESIMPYWYITGFSESLLSVEEKLNYECDDHFIIKLEGNKIKVNRKNKPNEAYKELKILDTVLTADDKRILSDGITVNSEYELLEIMESFNELQ
jgi:hypothetical protein